MRCHIKKQACIVGTTHTMTTISTSTSFQDLSTFASRLDTPADDVVQTLVPLAALAVKHAANIPGLEEVLVEHGWDGECFSEDVNTASLQKRLWRLFDDTAVEKKRSLMAKQIDDPLQNFRLNVLEICSKTDMPSGQLQSLMTHHVMITLIDLSKKESVKRTESFKRKMESCGWNRQHYAFIEQPDRAKLLDMVYED